MPRQDELKAQLEQVAKSYDRHIGEYGKKDALSYDNLPDYIINDPDYPEYKMKLIGVEGESSRRNKIKDYLKPAKDMNFIDLGCCLNLMFKGYDKWPSTYHGIDISEKTVLLLNKFVYETACL